MAQPYRLTRSGRDVIELYRKSKKSPKIVKLVRLIDKGLTKNKTLENILYPDKKDATYEVRALLEEAIAEGYIRLVSQGKSPVKVSRSYPNIRSALANKTRYKVYNCIKENPGIHYNKIRKDLNLLNGALSYHLQLLLKEKLVREEREGPYRRFYLPGSKTKMKPKSLERKIRGDMFQLIEENPGISQKELAEELDIKPSTVNYHSRVLIKSGLVKKKRRGMRVKYYIRED